MKGREFDKMSDYQFLKKGCASYVLPVKVL
jgi:hypothetical protein